MKITFLVPPPLKGQRPAERGSGCTHVVYPAPNIYELTAAALIEKTGHFDVAYKDFAYSRKEDDFNGFLLNDDSDFYSVWTVNLSLEADLHAARRIREARPGAYCLFTGPAATYYAEKCLADEKCVVVRGEPELALCELLEAFRSKADWRQTDGISYLRDGKAVNNRPHSLLRDLDGLPFPARHLLNRAYHNPKLKAKPYTAVVTSRQCPFRCIYCVPSSLTFAREIEYRRYNGRKPPVSFRSVENVDKELGLLAGQGYRAIGFMDDNFIWNEARTEALCGAISKYGFRWGCQARADAITEPIAEMLGKSRCGYVDLGVESFNDEILAYIKKGITKEQIYNAIGLLKKHKVPVKLNILIGASPLETKETLRDTIRQAGRTGADQIMFNIVSPFPGTEFYRLAKENGWFATKDKDYVPADVQRSSIVSYPGLPAAEMEKILFRANLRHFLSPSFVWKQLRRFRDMDEFACALKALKVKLLG